MADPSRVRVTGPLEPLQAGFAKELRRQGYTPGSAEKQVYLMAHLSRWLAAEGLDCAALSAVEAERFLAARRAGGCVHHRTLKAIKPLLAYLRAIGAVPASRAPTHPDPVEELLARYRSYLTVERGLHPETAATSVRSVRPFLEDRHSQNGLELERLSAAEVSSFMVARCTRLGRAEAKRSATALRSLLSSFTWRA